MKGKTDEQEELILDNENTNLSFSWAIKLPNNNQSAPNNTVLHMLATKIAEENDLMNYGPIGGLNGYFYFVHKHFFSNDFSNPNGHAFKVNITQTLRTHPEIEWVKHEVIRMRKKRALEFKDQFFPSQWHLVIPMIFSIFVNDFLHIFKVFID